MGSHSKRAHTRKRSAARRRSMAAGATLAMTLPVLGFLAQSATASTDAPIDCADGRVFVLPGTADPNSLHTAGLATRYGTDGKNYRIQIVEYPGQIWPAGGVSYDESVDIGITNLEAAAKAYAEACDGKPVVIVGYSQGARIAGDVLSEIGNGTSTIPIDQELVSGELYSDPRREGDSQGRGIELILPGVLPGITMSGSRAGFGNLDVTQFCVEGDPICDLQDPLHYPLRAVDGLLGYFVKHVTYDDDIENGPDVSSGGSDDVLIPSDPAIGVIFESLGLPYYNVTQLDNPLMYPDLVVLRPLFLAVNQLVPALPSLGHGAYLPDLYALRDALSGDRVAWEKIGGSALSILRYPENFVRDWITEIDKQLDQRDGARLGVLTPTTTAAADDAPQVSTTAVVAETPAPAGVAPERPAITADSPNSPAEPTVVASAPTTPEPASQSEPAVPEPAVSEPAVSDTVANPGASAESGGTSVNEVVPASDDEPSPSAAAAA